jgi:hypothetical protein
MNEFKTFDIDTLKKRITLFKKLGKLSWILNIILLGLSFYQFVLVGYRFKIDAFFVIVNILNVITFYLTYKIYDRLSLYRLRYSYAINNPQS